MKGSVYNSYGYLPRKVKTTVDEIVNEMERLPLVDQCYQVWWELQCEIEDYYSERQRECPPLSERKELRLIKNAVIQEAENIRLGVVPFEDEGIEENREDEQNEQAEERTAQSRNLWSLAAAYRETKTILYDDGTRWEEKEAAIHTLEQLREKKIAMGHKPDDHEEKQQQGWTMTMEM